eukprot:scaffold2135_cov341-Prasinococcus_capsulatus_cf.AAC.12
MAGPASCSGPSPLGHSSSSCACCQWPHGHLSSHRREARRRRGPPTPRSLQQWTPRDPQRSNQQRRSASLVPSRGVGVDN